MIHFSNSASAWRFWAKALSGLVAGLGIVSAASAAELDFNVASGNYNVAGNWVDATTGAVSPAAPGSADTAYVRNNGAMTINSDVSATLIRIGASKEIPDPSDPTGVAEIQVGMGGSLNWTAGEITGPTGFHTGGPDLRLGQHINLSATNPTEYDFPGIAVQNGATTKIMLISPDSKLTIGDNGSTPNPVDSYTLMNGTIGTAIGGAGINGANGNNGINVKNGTFTMTGGQIIDATPQDLIDNGLTTQRFMTISSNTGTAGSENYASATFTGGTVNVLGGFRVAPNANSKGVLNINGPVTITTGGDTAIGYNATNGVGEMNMSAGTFNVGRTDIVGQSLTGRFQVGQRGKGTLNMSGGTINVTNQIRVGAEFAAGGSLINQTGGTITTPSLTLGIANGDPIASGYLGASIILDGPNAVFTQNGSGGTIIANQGASLFEVRQGTATLGASGSATSPGFINVGNLATSQATLNVKGGKLIIGGTLGYTLASNPPPPVIGLTGGTLEFNNALNANAQTWQPNFSNTGSKLVLTQGALRQVVVGGDASHPSNFSMTSGSWDVEIGLHNVLGADWFNATNGTASLTGGTINVSYLSGFTPADNEVFRILRGTAGVTLNTGGVTITGTDASHWSLQAVTNSEIQLKYSAASAGVSGDYNGNGVVDAADYVLWRNGGPLLNDPTPGVQAADYTYWRSRFGATSGAGAGAGLGASTAVPEPTSIALLVLAVAGLLSSKRTRFGA